MNTSAPLPALYKGVDSARAGNPLPPYTKILAAYIGASDMPGRPDARHVWTMDEWNMYLNPDSVYYGGAELRALPIYVHDYPGDPLADAKNAADAAIDLGWSDAVGRLLFWDAETLVDPAYCSALNLELRLLGFRLGKYGSQGTINQNPPVAGGTWIATDSRIAPSQLPPGCVGDQWLFGGPWDFSVFGEFVYANCGRGPRHVP